MSGCFGESAEDRAAENRLDDYLNSCDESEILCSSCGETTEYQNFIEPDEHICPLCNLIDEGTECFICGEETEYREGMEPEGLHLCTSTECFKEYLIFIKGGTDMLNIERAAKELEQELVKSESIKLKDTYLDFRLTLQNAADKVARALDSSYSLLSDKEASQYKRADWFTKETFIINGGDEHPTRYFIPNKYIV